MLNARCLGVNAAGHLTIGGRDTVELAQTYGTPLYVMDENEIRGNCRSYRHSIDKYYGGRGLVAYASKAFNCKAICRIVMEEGLGLDVVSGGELYTAMSVGFPAQRIIFHGNNKSPDELAMAIGYGVGRIVVDNMVELHLISQMAKSKKETAHIMLRIKPGIDAHTHNFVRTGQIDSKFGFALETGEAMEAVKTALAAPGVELRGLHCHIGSQIFDVEPFELAAQVMAGFMGDIRDQTGVALGELNLGGGFGICYTSDNDPPAYDSYMERVSKALKKTCLERNLETPFILIEPGRSIVGPAGITLYRVGAVKEIPGVRTYVSVDGGMTDNPRYILYQSQYTFTVASRAADAKVQGVTVAGKCCESGDLLGENVPLQEVHPGDILAVLATGAYNYSMASNYNRTCRPPVVLVNGQTARVIIRRESYEDLIRNDEE